MSSSELINSASEDENNGTKESETSEFQQSPLKKIAQEKNHRIQKKTLVAMEILSGVLVGNTNQWLLMQKAFTAWIKMQFVTFSRF